MNQIILVLNIYFLPNRTSLFQNIFFVRYACFSLSHLPRLWAFTSQAVTSLAGELGQLKEAIIFSVLVLGKNDTIQYI